MIIDVKIIAPANSGKTTILYEVVQALRAKGLQVYVSDDDLQQRTPELQQQALSKLIQDTSGRNGGPATKRILISSQNVARVGKAYSASAIAPNLSDNLRDIE